MSKTTNRTTIHRKRTNRDLVSTKLTDAQRIVLSSAAQRDDGAAAVPDRMTEKAALKLEATLIRKGLVREVRAKAGTPVWRRNEVGRACALIITKLGRTAIEGEDAHKLGEADVDAPTSYNTDAAESAQPERSPPRHGSKLADVISLLGRQEGAGIAELTSTTGWLPHTTRAALTGLRKRGYAIERTRPDAKGSLYRIVGHQKAQAEA
jgi:hypothetical protein